MYQYLQAETLTDSIFLCFSDFDLEAHIATLPPCSMDSLSRKKRRHASGGNQTANSNNNNSSSIGGHKSSSQSEGEWIFFQPKLSPDNFLTGNMHLDNFLIR